MRRRLRPPKTVSWTVDAVSGLRDELAGKAQGRARKRGV